MGSYHGSYNSFHILRSILLLFLPRSSKLSLPLKSADRYFVWATEILFTGKRKARILDSSVVLINVTQLPPRKPPSVHKLGSHTLFSWNVVGPFVHIPNLSSALSFLQCRYLLCLKIFHCTPTVCIFLCNVGCVRYFKFPMLLEKIWIFSRCSWTCWQQEWQAEMMSQQSFK